MLGLKLTTMCFKLRRATASNADAIANVYWASFCLLTFLPMLHTIAFDAGNRIVTAVVSLLQAHPEG